MFVLVIKIFIFERILSFFFVKQKLSKFLARLKTEIFFCMLNGFNLPIFDRIINDEISQLKSFHIQLPLDDFIFFFGGQKGADQLEICIYIEGE